MFKLKNLILLLLLSTPLFSQHKIQINDQGNTKLFKDLGDCKHFLDEEGNIVEDLSGDIYYDCYNDDANSLFLRWDDKGTIDLRNLVSDMMDSLQLTDVTGGGIWDTLDVIVLTGMHTEQASELNWKGNIFNLDTIGNLEWIPYYGFKGDGNSTYINTNFNPYQASISGSKLQRNNASFSISLDSLGGTGAYHGLSNGASSLMIVPNYFGECYGRAISTANTTQANTGTNQVFTVSRQDGTSHHLYVGKNKSSAEASSFNLSNIDLNLYVLARNNNNVAGQYSSNNVNAYLIGGALTDDQVNRWNDLIDWFIGEIRIIGLEANISAVENTFYLQSAINGGNKNILVDKKGTYLLDSTIFIYSNTELNFANDVFIQQNRNYSNVFANIGIITKDTTRNIQINGLNLITDGKQASPEHTWGLRGKLGFLYIDSLVITNFICRDGGSLQFMIQIGGWNNLYIDNVIIESQKDGIDLLAGGNGVIKNCYLETYDDAIFLGAVGFPTAQLEVIGDVHDISFTNINYYDSTRTYPARGCYVMLASWNDWTIDSVYQTGDMCLNDGKLYQCANSNGFFDTAAIAPTHNADTITGVDGITWHYIDTTNIYKSNVYNISFDSSSFYDCSNFLYFANINSEYSRNIYPGTEDSSVAYNFSVNNSTINNTRALNVSTNILDITFSNCNFDSLDYFILNTSSGLESDSVYVISEENNFTNSSLSKFIYAYTKKIVLESTNDTYSNSTFVNSVFSIEPASGILRVINNQTLPFSSLTNISPETNDICTDLTGTYQWDGDSWEEYIP